MRNTWQIAAPVVLFGALMQAGAAEPGPGAQTPHLSHLREVAVVALVEEEQRTGEAGWFGVRLEAPGPALAKQLNLADRGLLITNICADSPAERAGLQQYDVVIHFAGKPIGSDVTSLATQIRELGPGAATAMIVLRNSQEIDLDVTLTAWPEHNQWQWRFEEMPEVVVKDFFDVGGKILRHVPGGEVVVEELDMPGLPDELRVLIPRMSHKTFEVWHADGQARLKCKAVKDGLTFEIEQDADGRFHVRRITHHDDLEQVDEQVYENEQALLDGDEEAYGIWGDPQAREITGGVMVQPQSGGVTRVFSLPQLPRIRTLRSAKEPGKPHERQHVRLEKIKEWHEAMEDGLKTMNLATRQQLEAQLAEVREHMELLEQSQRQAELSEGEPPRLSFSIDSNGRLTAVIREGDTEVRKIYRSVKEFEEKDPRLFERYRDLVASE